MYARLATYRHSGDARDLAKRAEQGMLPIFREHEGFRAYSLAESEGELLSLSVWDSAEQIDAANSAAAKWIEDNMAGEIELKEVRFGELLLSTTLGVSP
jgi:heme-degrading monooxygenase HmoA